MRPHPLLTVGGRAIGGHETCIDLPELRLCFDIGRCPTWAVPRPRVLVTHPHMDHLGGLAYHAATRAMLGMRPADYLVPPEEVERIEALFEVWRGLDRSELPGHVRGVGIGDAFDLGKGFAARPFRSVHRVACQGWSIWRRHKRLAPQFRGLPEAELARLAREDRRDLSTHESICELAFTGDTRIQVVEREEVVRKARVLVIECTFLDDRVDLARVHETGHIHLSEIVERAELFENERIVLTHFSARYSPERVRAILEAELPDSLRERVVPLLGQAPG